MQCPVPAMGTHGGGPVSMPVLHHHTLDAAHVFEPKKVPWNPLGVQALSEADKSSTGRVEEAGQRTARVQGI